MKPVDLLQSKKGMQVMFECTRCHKRQPNIVALDTAQDDLEALLEWMRETGPPV